MIAAFRQGLRFKCTACGECCTRLRANLPLSSGDVRRISRYLRMSIRSFVEAYGVHVIDRVRDQGSVVDIPSIELRVPSTGVCVFLDRDRRCTIHEVKPAICARTPFVDYVANGRPTIWKEAVSYCPGIGLGERYSPARVNRLLREEMEAEDAEIDALVRGGGELNRLLRTRLPAPEVRETHATEGGEDDGPSKSTPAVIAERQGSALGFSTRRGHDAAATRRDPSKGPGKPGAARTGR